MTTEEPRVRVRTQTTVPLPQTQALQVRTRTPRRPAHVVQLVEIEGHEGDDPLLAMVRSFNRVHALILIGGKTRILWETDTDDAGFRLLDIRAFHDLYADLRVELPDGKEQPATRVWVTHSGRRTLAGITFAPGQARQDGRFYNTWRGFAFEPNPEGNCELFLEHLRENVARGDTDHYRYILGWWAQMFQKPQTKPGTSLTTRGRMGTGKTIIGETFGKLIPAHYILLDQAGQLTGRFSGHLNSRLLIHADEAFFAGSKSELGRLKSLVTSARIPIERKMQDIITIPNYARLFITSNEKWVVPAALEERRFAVFDVGERNIQDHEFFGEVVRQLEEESGYGRLLHELLTFDLSTVDLRHVPLTPGLIEQKVQTLEPVDAFIYVCLHEGQLLPDQAWNGGSVCREDLYARLQEFTTSHYSRSRARVPTIAQLGVRLRQLFPDLGEERPRQGGRRRHWVLGSHATYCESFEQATTIPILRPADDPDDPWDGER